MEKNEEIIVFGKLLKELRVKSGKTQEVLAFDIGVERVYISMLERGINGPSLNMMVRIAKAFNLKLSELAALFEKRL